MSQKEIELTAQQGIQPTRDLGLFLYSVTYCLHLFAFISIAILQSVHHEHAIKIDTIGSQCNYHVHQRKEPLKVGFY